MSIGIAVIGIPVYFILKSGNQKKEHLKAG
jgi:hypothetical protein